MTGQESPTIPFHGDYCSNRGPTINANVCTCRLALHPAAGGAQCQERALHEQTDTSHQTPSPLQTNHCKVWGNTGHVGDVRTWVCQAKFFTALIKLQCTI